MTLESRAFSGGNIAQSKSVPFTPAALLIMLNAYAVALGYVLPGLAFAHGAHPEQPGFVSFVQLYASLVIFPLINLLGASLFLALGHHVPQYLSNNRACRIGAGSFIGIAALLSAYLINNYPYLAYLTPVSWLVGITAYVLAAWGAVHFFGWVKGQLIIN